MSEKERDEILARLALMRPADGADSILENVDESLAALLDGSLPEAERDALMRRLESDPELYALWLGVAPELASQPAPADAQSEGSHSFLDWAREQLSLLLGGGLAVSAVVAFLVLSGPGVQVISVTDEAFVEPVVALRGPPSTSVARIVKPGKGSEIKVGDMVSVEVAAESGTPLTFALVRDGMQMPLYVSLEHEDQHSIVFDLVFLRAGTYSLVVSGKEAMLTSREITVRDDN